jgi:hypothetical protein
MRAGGCRTLRAGVAALALALPGLAGSAAAQDAPPAVTPSLMLSGYNRHPVGVLGSIEGGAIAARASDSSSLWYNPAGQATHEELVFSGSASVFEWTWTTVDGHGDWIDDGYYNSVRAAAGGTAAALGSKEWFWGGMIAAPRSWRQASNTEALVDTADGLRMLAKVDTSEIETYFAGLGLGWKPRAAWRFGASAGVLGSWFQADQSATARELTDGGGQSVVAVLRASGVSYDLRLNAGVQHDVGERLTVGLSLRSPGLHLWDTADLSYDLLGTGAGGASQVTFRDTGASTEYRYPLEGTLGVAYRGDTWALECDVTAYDSIPEYTFLGSDKVVRVATGDALARAQFNDVRVSADPVVNLAIGGRVRLARNWKLHGGAYTDISPAPAEGKVFDQIDLYGLTLGVSFEVRRNTFWVVGVNYLHGSRGDLPVRDLATGALVPADVTVDTISAVLGSTMEF